VLREFGGCEIAMMAGAVLGAASSAATGAHRRLHRFGGGLGGDPAEPAARDYCVFAHRSAERGHRGCWRRSAPSRCWTLDLRLGEGTGALLALPLVRAAARLLTTSPASPTCWRAGSDMLRGQLQIKLLACAIQFLTRLPPRHWRDFRSRTGSRAPRAIFRWSARSWADLSAAALSAGGRGLERLDRGCAGHRGRDADHRRLSRRRLG
jgi:hypothetical protein